MAFPIFICLFVGFEQGLHIQLPKFKTTSSDSNSITEDNEELYLSKDAYTLNKKYIESWKQKNIRKSTASSSSSSDETKDIANNLKSMEDSPYNPLDGINERPKDGLNLSIESTSPNSTKFDSHLSGKQFDTEKEDNFPYGRKKKSKETIKKERLRNTSQDHIKRSASLLKLGDKENQPYFTDDSDGISSDEEDYLYYGKERKEVNNRNKNKTNQLGNECSSTQNNINISAQNSNIQDTPKGNQIDVTNHNNLHTFCT